MDGNEILNSVQFSLIQLVEMGLCKYHEFIDGTLNYRDVIVLLEYAKLKDTFISWKQQHEELKHKQV